MKETKGKASIQHMYCAYGSQCYRYIVNRESFEVA